MISRSAFYSILLFLCSLSPSLHSANIIMDLGDVLLETNPIAAWWYSGPKQWLRYFATFHSPHKIRTTLYNFLEDLTPNAQDSVRAHDNKGRPLPPIMCDWLSGKCSCATVLQEIEIALQNSAMSITHQKLIRTITQMMFTPETFIKTCRFIPDGIQFINTCKQDGHHLYILSNWDPESFALLVKQYPDFFNLFDGIVISGTVGYNKPHRKIYKYLLKTYGLKARDSIFIDDQEINIEAAKKLNIHGIVCPKRRSFFSKKPDFALVYTQIQQYLHA